MVNIPFSQLKADSPLNLGDKNITSVDELILTEVGNSSPTQKSVKLKVNADGSLVVVGAATEVVLYNPISESINNSILPASLQSLSSVPVPTVADNNKILKVLNNGTSTTYVWDTLGFANFISVNSQGSYNNINFDGFLTTISGSSITIRPQGGGTTSTGGSGFTITGQETPYQINTKSVANPSLMKFTGNFTTTVDGGNITIDNSIAVTGNVTGGDKVIGFRIGTGLTGVVANDKYLDITADAVTGGGTGLTSIGAGGNVTGGTSFTSLNLGSNVTGVINAGIMTINVTGSASINYSSLTASVSETSTHRIVAEGASTNSVKFRRIKAIGAIQIDVVNESGTGGASKVLEFKLSPAVIAGSVLTWDGTSWKAIAPSSTGTGTGTGTSVSELSIATDLRVGRNAAILGTTFTQALTVGGEGSFTSVVATNITASGTLGCGGLLATYRIAVEENAVINNHLTVKGSIYGNSDNNTNYTSNLYNMRRVTSIFHSFANIVVTNSQIPYQLSDLSPGDVFMMKFSNEYYLVTKTLENTFRYWKASGSL